VHVVGNRGITADCFILEEAAYIPRGILTQIIAPMLKVSNSVLIAISTHSGSGNYFSRLMTDKDPVMDRLFVRLRVDLMCASCKKRGVKPSDCTHKAALNPSWLLGSNEDRVKKLIGDEETYAREVMGAFMSNSNQVFRQSWLDDLSIRPSVSIDRSNNTGFLFSMIDPAGGGDSKTAIVTIMRRVDGSIVIIGLSEACIMEGPQLSDWCSCYMKHFVEDPMLNKMHHWVACERNYGGSVLASSFVQACTTGYSMAREYQTEQDKHGTWTSPEVNKTGVMTLMFELHDQRVSFGAFLATDRPFTCSDSVVGATAMDTGTNHAIRRPSSHHEHNSLGDESRKTDTSAAVGSLVDIDDNTRYNKQYQSHCQSLKTTLVEQLGKFQKSFKTSGSWTYTGKDGKGGRDDLAMCLVMAVYHSVLCAVEHTSVE